ncbi:MAG: hypothetical protein WCT85_05525, partial [Parachlamydiales bacterium]
MTVINNQNFSYSVLQDENRFNDFFSGKSQIETIKNDYLNGNFPIFEVSSTTMKIIDFIKAPFEIIGIISFYVASKVLFFSSLSTRCRLIVDHLLYSMFHSCIISMYKNKLISSSKNV